MINSKGQFEQSNVPSPVKGGKKGSLGLVIKVALVALIFIGVFYLIYFSVQYGKANFVLSDREITSDSDPVVERFKTGGKIYFFINRISKDLDSSLFTIEIEKQENNEFRHHKQVSYEIEKSFPQMGAYLPQEYFRKAGKYRIKALLDGKVVATHPVEVSD
ncbi:MAG: hypothetical protein EPN93_04430 [Spirochaetes bacterium]|nr:MAG: hypothetical protein EPN93_04430 [Spirochaetota bacterium]